MWEQQTDADEPPFVTWLAFTLAPPSVLAPVQRRVPGSTGEDNERRNKKQK